ncbi:hypothetical protein Tco_0720704, partial [Tanacetum coccineum]
INLSLHLRQHHFRVIHDDDGVDKGDGADSQSSLEEIRIEDEV